VPRSRLEAIHWNVWSSSVSIAYVYMGVVRNGILVATTHNTDSCKPSIAIPCRQGK